MQKLINVPSDVDKEALQGMAAAHGDLLKVSVDPAYIVRADVLVRGKVAVLSGGGSGHDPLTISLLVGLGVDELSMNTVAMPCAEQIIRDLDYGAVQLLAGEVMQVGDIGRGAGAAGVDASSLRASHEVTDHRHRSHVHREQSEPTQAAKTKISEVSPASEICFGDSAALCFVLHVRTEPVHPFPQLAAPVVLADRAHDPVVGVALAAQEERADAGPPEQEARP